MKPTIVHLLLILTISCEIVCYDTSLPDFKTLQDDIFKAKTKNAHRIKRAPGGYRGYSDSHFYGMQSKINNQFAEFLIQAATFATGVQRDRSFYFNIAKTCKILRLHVIGLHFFIYVIAVVIPAVLGLIMAICVWQSLVRQIDGIVKAPPDGAKLPPLANKPPGFYVPLHRRPLIYLQLMKEKCCGKKGTYHENVLRRRKRKKPTKPNEKKKADEKKGDKKDEKKK